jgi:ferredoxin-NADP reductase
MKQWLDRVTGSVTMYALLLIVLGAITVAALILSLFGQLSNYSPLAVIVTNVVAVGVTVASSILFGLVFRAKPHLESAIITGVLLFLLFSPTLDPTQLGGIALAGVIASLSKFVLAVRGRHIANPAAVGAVVVALTGLNFAVWWAATPWLLPIVAVGAFLVLYRTQRLTMAVVFMAVAAAIIAVRITIGGADLGSAIATAFLSYPIVFLAGFMLSEPLTLPPRRWQQLVIAVLVGVLFSVPYSFGPIYSSPEIALVVGNVVAFFFGQRRAIRMEYLGKRELSPTTWELSFQPSRPVRFLPGQYMELSIPHRKADFRGSRRYFSIASAPTDDGPLTFAITVPEKSSSFKRALLDLEPGAEVRGTGVGGDFALPRDVSQPLLLVAGGIGITPFASQLAHAVERGEKRDVVVAYANSTPGELPYRALLEQSGARVVVFSPTEPTPLPAGWVYGGPGRVTGERLAEAVPDAGTRRAFISGPPALVNDLRRALRSLGARRVHTDYFSGY